MPSRKLRSATADASLLRRNDRSGGVGSGGAKATSSVWALSPSCDRSERLDDSMAFVGGNRKRRGVLGLLRKGEKKDSMREEVVHEMRILEARYLQWRFVNARAEAAVDSGGVAAKRKLFNTWLKLRELGKLVVAKKKLVQRARSQLKLHRILIPQIELLSKWERKTDSHMNAAAEYGSILQDICASVPLVEGAQAKVESLEDALSDAMNMIEETEAQVSRFYAEMDVISSLTRELVGAIQPELEALKEMMLEAERITALKMHEISLRATLLQTAENRYFQ